MEQEFEEVSRENKQNNWLSMKDWRKRLYTEGAILAVDEYSLILFPTSFIIFNIVYWLFVAYNDSEPTLTSS